MREVSRAVSRISNLKWLEICFLPSVTVVKVPNVSFSINHPAQGNATSGRTSDISVFQRDSMKKNHAVTDGPPFDLRIIAILSLLNAWFSLHRAEYFCVSVAGNLFFLPSSEQ